MAATAGPNIHPVTPYYTPKTSIRVSAANANRDGTGTIPAVFTAGVNGGVVSQVRAIYTGAVTVASTAMVLRLWHRIAGAGTYFLIDEIAMATTTPSTTAAATGVIFSRTNIPLGPSDVLAVSQTVAENVDYSADGGNF